MQSNAYKIPSCHINLWPASVGNLAFRHNTQVNEELAAE